MLKRKSEARRLEQSDAWVRKSLQGGRKETVASDQSQPWARDANVDVVKLSVCHRRSEPEHVSVPRFVSEKETGSVEGRRPTDVGDVPASVARYPSQKVGTFGRPAGAEANGVNGGLGNFERVDHLLIGECIAAPGSIREYQHDPPVALGPVPQLLRRLIASADRMPVLVVATFRESEVSSGDALAGLLADLRRESNATRLEFRVCLTALALSRQPHRHALDHCQPGFGVLSGAL